MRTNNCYILSPWVRMCSQNFLCRRRRLSCSCNAFRYDFFVVAANLSHIQNIWKEEIKPSSYFLNVLCHHSEKDWQDYLSFWHFFRKSNEWNFHFRFSLLKAANNKELNGREINTIQVKRKTMPDWQRTRKHILTASDKRSFKKQRKNTQGSYWGCVTTPLIFAFGKRN